LSDLPDPRNLVLVGVLWGEDDKFALVENTRGQNFVLREGDPVWRGRIVTVEPKSITIRYNHFGMWETINLPLSVGKEAIHAVER
ncbi:MAG: hypothetical protein KJ927_13570, partial [Candidatus Eisenbacteria bacterium]|nr:hypothetical protein [Candidatus Eisenbacteria bacterium]